ncbi:MAG: sporulation protein YqfD [Clostridia bacterium]|nr:sporulation protein YqfD [Clostridia bacterium]
MIIKRILDYFKGSIDISFSKDNAADIVDFLVGRKIGYEYIRKNTGDELSLKIKTSDYKKYKDDLPKYGVTAGNPAGFPLLFKKYGKRYGLWTGAAVFTIMVILSQRIVWNIEVYGCESITPESVVEKLESLGFTYGTYFIDTDFDKLHNDYLRLYDDVAWISVNMKGTIAKVEVKEISLPSEEDNDCPQNVVASEGGKIISVEPHGGKPVVAVGDYVSKGDLLLTGIINVGEDGLRFDDADGIVRAEVRREYTDEIPKIRTEKIYTGNECYENDLIFFKNRIKLFGKGRISLPDYDKIYNKERIYLFSVIPLPLFNDSVVYKEYYTTDLVITKEEATRLFSDSYNSCINSILNGAELLSVKRVFDENDDYYLMKYEVICISDISEIMKIVVE